MIYIDPKLVQDALGGRSLPFVASPVVETTLLSDAFASDAWDMDAEVDELSRTEIATAAAAFLAAAASRDMETTRVHFALSRLSRIRDLIAETPARRYSLNDMERLSGLDRWTIARQFRALFGTSPSRFRTLRQLDVVRKSISQGAALADASLAAGFADQSHMSRHFKRTYGLTPAAWVAALAASSI